MPVCLLDFSMPSSNLSTMRAEAAVTSLYILLASSSLHVWGNRDTPGSSGSVSALILLMLISAQQCLKIAWNGMSGAIASPTWQMYPWLLWALALSFLELRVISGAQSLKHCHWSDGRNRGRSYPCFSVFFLPRFDNICVPEQCQTEKTQQVLTCNFCTVLKHWCSAFMEAHLKFASNIL